MELTATEKKVLAYIGSGFEIKVIASKLFRSYYTIAGHSKSIQLKNGYNNISEGVRDFVLEFGDPRKFIALVFLTIQLGSIAMSEESIKRFKRTSKRTTKIRRC